MVQVINLQRMLQIQTPNSLEIPNLEWVGICCSGNGLFMAALQKIIPFGYQLILVERGVNQIQGLKIGKQLLVTVMVKLSTLLKKMEKFIRELLKKKKEK